MDSGAIDQMREAGAIVHLVDMRRTPWHPANARALTRLRRLIAERRPEVVHGHSAVGGALARAATSRGTIGTGTIARFYTPNGLPTGRPARAIERRLGRRTDCLIAVSPSEAARAIDEDLVANERIAMIPNGIDLTPPNVEAVDIRAQLGLPPSTPLIGTIARLVPQKAPEQYIRTCREVAARRPEVHFLLIGGGPLQRTVDRELAAGGLRDQFHQLDFLANAWAALDQLDVFVLLSAFEGGPYTPLEAMRAGVPVVLSDVVGNRDAVTDGVTGFLAPFGASDQAAAAIVKLLADDGLRTSVVAAASNRLRSQFDVRLMGASLNRLYARAASSGPDTRRRTRRLPQPASTVSTNAPDASASQ
jgi:glycosyltransferase involved in cell wall biosynthesis